MTEEHAADTGPEFHDELASEAVKIALAEEAQGVFENDNDNRGPRVDEYQAVGGGHARLTQKAVRTGADVTPDKNKKNNVASPDAAQPDGNAKGKPR